jgi:hypothetical protein
LKSFDQRGAIPSKLVRVPLATAINVPFAVLARKAGLCDGQRPAESPVEPGKLNACDEKLQRVDR